MKAFLSKISQLLHLDSVPRVKKTIVAVIGGTVLLVGVCFLFLPGPGSVIIIVGLAILATEFVWAQRWLKKARDLGARAKKTFSSRAAVPAPHGEASPSASPKTK